MIKHKYKLMTQTQIGSLFGTTSHQIGKWLIEIGLRTEGGKPSHKAFEGEYCDTAPSHGQGYHYVWVVEKTVAALERAGHQRVDPPPLDLVEPPPLMGPFSERVCADGRVEILGSDGSMSLMVLGEQNAGFVLRLLNLAHSHGMLGVPEPT
jgi:hypothetical protein